MSEATAPPPIQRLPRDVAERIAAGEVIERPVSVVRELLDNAIDAGSREITVEVRGGGLELIRVSDDGIGIPADQVEVAFERHATSKLRVVDDLWALHTLGFRGEALASIGAVAEVTLLTRAEPDPLGTQIVFQGGEVVRTASSARQRGTTVAVRHLFHNVPARLKFLAGGRGESLLIGQLIRRYALAYPALRLTLLLDGHPSFRASGSGDLSTVLAEVYGPSVAQAMRALPAAEVEGAHVSGYVSGQTVTRPGRQHLTLIVNGRWAASRGLLVALEAAYRPLLPRGRHPVAALFLDVPPAELDANVHPAKTEVKLLREAEVAAALAASVREALGRTPAQPDALEDFALGATQLGLAQPRRRLAESAPPAWGAPPEDEPALDRAVVLAQVHESLILVQAEQGLLLVDQHRAHERVIYEGLLAQSATETPSQTLLEPLVLELKPHQAALVDERLADLVALGFECERFGSRDFLLRAVPQVPGGQDIGTDLQEVLEAASAEHDGWRERLLAALACRAAVRRNHPLEDAHMRRLVQDLALTASPAVCPHGSPLILHFSGSFLRRQFRWGSSPGIYGA